MGRGNSTANNNPRRTIRRKRDPNIHYLTIEECCEYKNQFYNESTYESLFKNALRAAERNHRVALLKILDSTYVEIKSETVENDNHGYSTVHYANTLKYIDIKQHDRELLTVAINAHAKNVVEHLIEIEKVSFTDQDMLGYINRQINVMGALQQSELIPDLHDTFLHNQDPHQCALFLFKYYITRLINDISEENNKKIVMMLHNLSVCMTKEDQAAFLPYCHYCLYNSSEFNFLYTPINIVDVYSALDCLNPIMTAKTKAFNDCMNLFSQCGFTLYLRTLNFEFKNFIKDSLRSDHWPQLIKDKNNNYLFWGYSNGAWQAHEIDVSHIPLSWQKTFDSINWKNRYFVFIEDNFYKTLSMYHTPLIDKVDQLDNEINNHLESYRNKIDAIINYIMEYIQKQAAREAKNPHFLLFFQGATVFTKMQNNLKNIAHKPEEAGQLKTSKRVILLLKELKKAYNSCISSFDTLKTPSESYDNLKNLLSHFMKIQLIKEIEFEDGISCNSEHLKDWHTKIKTIRLSDLYHKIIPLIDERDERPVKAMLKMG